METFFIYSIKVNIALLLFYLMYKLLFRKDTFIRLRRYYFLSAIIFSLSYPIFSVASLGNIVDFSSTSTTPPVETTVTIGELSMESMVVEQVAEQTSSISWTTIAKNIFIIGVLFFGIRLAWQIFSILRIRWRSQKRLLFGQTIFHLTDEVIPFSFFNWIFIHTDKHSEEELKQILLHEQTHVRQHHSIDVMLVEFLRIFFWYNPVIWLMKRDIAINLEYLADNAVLQKGINTKDYQYHLLQLTYHETAVQIVNNFNVPQLKQRIMMMNSKKSPMRKLAKYLSILPLALLLITANSVYAQQNETEQEKAISQEQEPQKKESKSDEVFMVVENQPSFKEGVQAMMEFIESEMKYPVIAKENGIEGRVIVNFIVEKDGSISDADIVRGIDPSLDKEAVRIIEAMPKWNPGTQRGQKVRVRYTLPITFNLDENKDSSEMATASVKVLKDKESSNNEIEVIGYDSTKQSSAQTLANKFGDKKPLYIVDGIIMDDDFDLNNIYR